MEDRITPYNEKAGIEVRIDEIVASDTDVHIEMMDGASAWMRVGDEVFWIHAEKGKKLVIRHSETRTGYSKPAPPEPPHDH